VVAVRVPVRVKVRGRLLETVALANSGYEAETPQLLIPVEAARRLGLWPPDSTAIETSFETAGGPLNVWVYPRAGSVEVEDGGVKSPEVIVDIVVSPLADEVLLSDALISELGIVLEDAKKGLWRFRWEPPGRLHSSRPPQYWRR
jgi:hypothetical protein